MKPLKIAFGEDVTRDYAKSREKEWLLTNGLGGYASSTITGANTRGYHGLLVAFGETGERTLLLSKFEEEAIIGGKRIPLSTNRYPGVIHPEGYRHLRKFRLNPNPTFTYDVEGYTVTKTIHMPKGCNCSVTTYTADADIELEIRPLTTNRNHHRRLRADPTLFTQHHTRRGVTIKPRFRGKTLTLESNIGSYQPREAWYLNIIYDEEAARGLDDREDLYSPGSFTASVSVGEPLRIIANSEPTSPPLVTSAPLETPEDLHGWLVHAADQFITRRGMKVQILAGYHWFDEWGRDSAISIPGLLLAMGRYAEAKNVIRRLLSQTRNGLTPNTIGDEGESTYTSADASLWLIYAAQKYHAYAGDIEFIEEIYPALREVVECNSRGNTCLSRSADGLLETIGENNSFTWMDARIDGTAVTPREGKCVEVNALYYNAVMSLNHLAKAIGEDAGLEEKALSLKDAFNSAFWNSEGGYLYDYVAEGHRNASIRPNQILSISLPFPVLERSRWESVYATVQRHLLTPYGLRTLSPRDPRYLGICAGSPRERDSAYHNGTVWAWLAGPYLTARRKLGHKDRTAAILLSHFKRHLSDAGLGAISEIFDGDPPYRPRGCIAQAWSVAEILRAMNEDITEGEQT